jgi:hypothetical protein
MTDAPVRRGAHAVGAGSARLPTCTVAAWWATRIPSSSSRARTRVSSTSVSAASVGGHRPHRRIRDRVQLGVDPAGRGRDPVPRVGNQGAFRT